LYTVIQYIRYIYGIVPYTEMSYTVLANPIYIHKHTHSHTLAQIAVAGPCLSTTRECASKKSKQSSNEVRRTAFTHARTHAQTHARTHTFTHAPIDACTHTFTHARMHAHRRTHVASARTVHIRWTYGSFDREVTKYTVIYGVCTQLCPALLTHAVKSLIEQAHPFIHKLTSAWVFRWGGCCWC